METEAALGNRGVGLVYRYILMNSSLFTASKVWIIGFSVSEGANEGGVSVGWHGHP